MNLAKKQEEIEEIRGRLHTLVNVKCGNLGDEEVVKLSMLLDRHIVEYEYAKSEFIDDGQATKNNV